MKHILRSHDIVKTDFVGAKDCFLYDSSGKRYTDFEAGIWCTPLGANHPEVQKAMMDQIGKIIHLGTRYPSELAEEAALAVQEISGMRDGKCVFLSSGSEAVEFGVQVARRVTGRNIMLTFTNSYHSAYGAAGQKSPDDWVFLDFSRCTECPHQETCSSDCPLLECIPFSSIAAFIFDGGNCHGTVKLPPGELVRKLGKRVKDEGGLLIANEITAGMGRTGAWFGHQHYGFHPDILAAGKGLGNGYPVSVSALSIEVAKQLERDNLRYAQSHQNDPLGCRVAKTVIRVMQQEMLVQRSCEVGAAFKSKLIDLSSHHPGIKDVRGRGLMIVVEIDSKQAGMSAEDIYYQLLDQGFIVGCSPSVNLIRFYPALTIPEFELDRVIEAMDMILSFNVQLTIVVEKEY